MDQRHEIPIDDERYPQALRQIPDAPKVLYCLGDPAHLDPGLAVIGSRKATPYGLGATRLFAGWAASQRVTIISGAAIGCDQEAHRSALAVNGSTVAVMGCGADVDYPSGASDLLDRIRRVGAVVSEVPWGTRPQRWLFPRRNRLIAGLSSAVLVVEASLPSGTFNTADYALDYDRQVLAVPGSIFAPECRGSNRLLSQGATPISDVTELGLALGIGSIEQLVMTADPAAEDSEHPLLAALLSNPMRPDDAARELGLHIVEVSRLLGRYESAGVLGRYPDGRYGPCVTMRQAIQSLHDEQPTCESP